MVDSIMLTGKVAIVTGAGHGIGLVIAEKLASRGASLAVVDIKGENAEKTAAHLNETGASAIGIHADVTNRQQVVDMVETVVDSFDKVDILVNNVGWDDFMPFVNTTEEFWDKVIAINYKGMLQCSKAVLEHMMPQQSGKIISIASDAGRVGSTGEAVYGGCKGAVIAFSKTLAREVARNKINVNVVSPGPTESWSIGPYNALDAMPAAQREMFDKMWPAIIKGIPLGRAAEGSDIAEAVAFFASPAADYITGQTLSVSGGLTMI